MLWHCTPGQPGNSLSSWPLSALERVPICSYGPRKLRLDGCDRKVGGCVIISRPDSWHVCSVFLFLCPKLTITSPCHLVPSSSLPHALGGWVDDRVSNTTNQQQASPGRADDWPFLYHSSALYCMILGRVLATPDLLISKSGPSLGDKMDQAHTSCHQHPLHRRCDLPSARHL